MGKSPRHFIATQLDAAVQAFGYAGGWSIERRARQRHGLEVLAEFATDLPPWPCASRRCRNLIRWNRGMKGFNRFCSRRCYLIEWRDRRRMRGQRSPSDLPEARREYAKQLRAGWDEPARARRKEVERRHRANMTAEQRHAKVRRDNQAREQRAPTRREALAPLARQLKAHGVSRTHLARRLGVTLEYVHRVFAGRELGPRVVDMARQMLDEPPHPAPAPLTEEENLLRERRRAYQREWRDRRNDNEIRRARYRSRTAEQIARGRERSKECWQRKKNGGTTNAISRKEQRR